MGDYVNSGRRLFVSAVGVCCFLALAAGQASGKEIGKISGEMVARGANKLIGRPYVYGGESPTRGIDCSALVRYIYRGFGITLPRRAAWQMNDTPACPTYRDLREAKIGDALYFRNRKTGRIHHVAIVTGFARDGTPIITHAKGKHFGVVREKMDSHYIREFAGFKRFQFCTSPLSGVYTNEEVARSIVFVAKQMGVEAPYLGKVLAYINNLEPLSIELSVGDERSKKLVEGLKKAGILVESGAGEIVVIHPKSIEDAGKLSSALSEYGIPHLAGLSLVPYGMFSKKEEGRFIFYPVPNLKAAEPALRVCVEAFPKDPVGAATCYKKWARRTISEGGAGK